MRYEVEGSEGEHECSLSRRGDGSFAATLGGREASVEVISTGPRGVEFTLDGAYHRAVYASVSTARIDLVIDGTPVSLGRHRRLDEIVYKNSGGPAAASESALLSKVPGKVVSVAGEGASVSEGETVCVLESMKMQISVEAPRGGTATAVAVKPGDTVAKGDRLMEIS